MTWKFPDNYPDPTKEGDAFCELLKAVNPEITFPRSSASYQDQIDHVFNWLAEGKRAGRHLIYLESFLSKILVPGGIACDLIQVWGVDQIIGNQSEYAPICNVDDTCGLIQFASWTGDYSDGDAWCLDLIASEVVCLPVASGEAYRAASREATYARLPNFSYFVSYLASSALQRGWLSEYPLISGN